MVVGIRSPHYLSPRLCPCEDAAVFAFLCPGTLETLHGLCPEIFVSESTPLLKLSGFLSLIEHTEAALGAVAHHDLGQRVGGGHTGLLWQR